jgi:hypothetical protein
MSDSETPWEPPLAGAEAEHLISALDRLRATFRWKADGLGARGLQARIGVSALTLGGLLKHLAAVEDYTFTTKLRGQPMGVPWDATGWDGSNDWEFTSAVGDTPEQLYALWDGAVEWSRTGSARPWPTAASASWSTPPGRMAAGGPACGGCCAT